MASDAPERGRGFFGYRRSVVDQIISNRDVMLRQAEGRVRAAESRVSELEDELNSTRERGRLMEEQLERLRTLIEDGRAVDVSAVLAEPIESIPVETHEVPGDADMDEARSGETAYGVAGEADHETDLRGDDQAAVALGSLDDEEDPMTHDMAYEGAGAGSAHTSEITTRFLTEELAGILTAAEESAARIVERAQASTEQQIAEANRLWREVQGEVARFAAWRQEVEPIIEQVRERVEDVRDQVESVPERIREALAPMADAISSVDASVAELAAAVPPPLVVAPAGLETDVGGMWDAGAGEPPIADAGDFGFEGYADAPATRLEPDDLDDASGEGS